MIGIDWGTSSVRAYRLDGPAVQDRLELPRGIMAVADGGFDRALREMVGPWLVDGERRILLSGMVGSRQGWIEAPYLPCPAHAAGLARALMPVPFDGAEVLLVPGLSTTGPGDVPDVMRGEEVQVFGVDGLGEQAVACLPGSHSKWVRVAAGGIEGFSTHLTGEAFAALRGHTILGRLMPPDAPHDPEAFRRGVLRSGEPGGLLHHAFGVRSLGLFGRLDSPASYLSGLLIGHEIRAAAADSPGQVIGAQPGPERPVHLIGAAALTALYADAIALCGGRATISPDDAAARGLALIGEQAAWTS